MFRFIPINNQACESNSDTTSFKTYLDRSLKGDIHIGPWMVVVTSINGSSGWRGAPMAPPPPSRLMDITTTQFKIKRNTWGQKRWDKALKTFVGEEIDDQWCINIDGLVAHQTFGD